MTRITRIDDVLNGTGVARQEPYVGPVLELPFFTRDGGRQVYFIRPNGTPRGEIIGPHHPDYDTLLKGQRE